MADVGAVVAQAVKGNLPFGSYALLLGGVMMAAGLGFKIAAVPFQMWVPDVYEGAPTPITAYLSVASKAAGFAALIRIFTTAFGGAQMDWSLLFAGMAVASMSIGNLVAIAQNNIKRMLAYSTIAHAGYMLVGVAAVAARTADGSQQGLEGVLFYLGAYAVTNLAAFFAIIGIANRVGGDEIAGFTGMSKRAPWLALLLAISMLSLIGFPPTAGFMGKLFLFGAAVKADMAWLAVAGVVNSVVSAYYYLRVLKVMYFSEPQSPEGVKAGWPLWASLAIASVGVAFLGVVPWPLFSLVERVLSGF
jgi:NADH-quinone oxidoreductase subunit N